jgi:hypothetical protein
MNEDLVTSIARACTKISYYYRFCIRDGFDRSDNFDLTLHWTWWYRGLVIFASPNHREHDVLNHFLGNSAAHIVMGFNMTDEERFSIITNADAIEYLIKRLLPGSLFDNTYCLCVCGRPRICTLMDGMWWCDECKEKHITALAQKKVIPPQKAERLKLTPKLRFTILKRDGFSCRICGRSPLKGHDITLHVDHIQPIVDTGKTNPDNLQTLCNECNLGKGTEYNEQINESLSLNSEANDES